MTSRDAAAKPNQILRSVMTTKSAVMDRLSSGLEQLVNVVSSHLPDHYDKNIQLDHGQTQCEGQVFVKNSLESYGSVVMSDSGSVPSDVDLAEVAVSLERATFPPGKRRRSCVADMTTPTMLDKADGGKYEPENRKINAAVGVTVLRDNNVRRIVKSLGYSSSFDLGMTQPGSLDIWRSNSERVRLPRNRWETDKQRVSHTASDVSGYCDSPTGERSRVLTFDTTATGNIPPRSSLMEDQRLTTSDMDEIVRKIEQQVEHSMTSHHHQHEQQQQQQDDIPLQQSRRRSDILTSAAWSKSSRRTRRRWSDLVVPPDTPPCSPSSPPGWFQSRFTAEAFVARDLRRRFIAEDSSETEAADVDENEPQVRGLIINRAVNVDYKKLNAEIRLKAHR